MRPSHLLANISPALLLFFPLFFLKSSPGSFSLSEAAACLGALFLYLLLERFISRLQLTNVLGLTILLVASVFALALFITPSLDEESISLQDIEEADANIPMRNMFFICRMGRHGRENWMVMGISKKMMYLQVAAI